MTSKETSETIRRARIDEAADLSALMFRSKASWGYDDHFMGLFRDDLSVSPEQIANDDVSVVEQDGRVAGLVHLRPQSESVIELVSLFIDTWTIRQGLGQKLWDHAVASARAQGFRTLILESDPYAEGFYRRQGAIETGCRESALLPGRSLAVMVVGLNEV